MKVVITGVSGRDDYFIVKLLLSKGYEIHGMLRRNSSITNGNMDMLGYDVKNQITIHYGDITY